MKTTQLDFKLPKGLIAQYPAPKRDRSKLLVLDRQSGRIRHQIFRDIVTLLSPGDVLVINNSRVIPARVLATKETGGQAELLLIRKMKNGTWECLAKPGKRIRAGMKLKVGESISAIIEERLERGKWQVSFSMAVEKWIERLGKVPLPPYITRDPSKKDKETYQTVYARSKGSVAAPTAGLHFTRDLLWVLKDKGVGICHVTLHVGPGTFRPVFSENVEEHKLDPEWAEIPQSCAKKINHAKEAGKRIIAVGTTTVRTLESFCDENGFLLAGSKMVNLLISPPFRFGVIDGLITNFHLPKSSLLALVCAFGGYAKVMTAYREAIATQYRFYSYGDAMILI